METPAPELRDQLMQVQAAIEELQSKFKL